MDLKMLEKTASLARLSLTENEKEQFLQQMSKVISYFEDLSQVQTDGVEPLVTPTPIENRLRTDEVHPWGDTDSILESVPERQGHLIKVPQVV